MCSRSGSTRAIRLKNRRRLGYARPRMSPQVAIDHERVRQFCERWRVTEFALFGSVLTEAFGPASDIDVLVTFAQEARWTLFDMVRMREELTQMFGRDVDLVSRGGLEASRNYLRRKGILSSARVIHAARP